MLISLNNLIIQRDWCWNNSFWKVIWNDIFEMKANFTRGEFNFQIRINIPRRLKIFFIENPSSFICCNLSVFIYIYIYIYVYKYINIF